MPKTKEQCLKIKEERRKEILRVSLYQFAFKGYKVVRVDDITKAAKCSHGLFYHYFKDTEDVFHSLMEEIVIPYIHRVVERIDEYKRPYFILSDLFSVIVSEIKNKDTDKACMFFLLLNLHLQKDEIPKPRKTSNEKDHRDRRMFTVVHNLIEAGQKDGDILKADSTELTVSVLSMIAGLAFNRVCLGYNKFVCPNGEVIAAMLKQKEERYA